jgi:hypothetical protein
VLALGIVVFGIVVAAVLAPDHAFSSSRWAMYFIQGNGRLGRLLGHRLPPLCREAEFVVFVGEKE